MGQRGGGARHGNGVECNVLGTLSAHEKLQLQRHLPFGLVGGKKSENVFKGEVGNCLGAPDLFQLLGGFDPTEVG